MARSLVTGLFVLAAFASGCSHEKRPQANAPVAPVSTTETTSAAIPRQTVVSEGLTVSEELANACNLHSGPPAPKFAFDEDGLGLADYEMLQLIAKCVTSGPLAGRALMLTGRTDTDGTEEYNMALGARRANAVATTLRKFGANQLRETSRGELDATMDADPATRQLDRRVDITLAK